MLGVSMSTDMGGRLGWRVVMVRGGARTQQTATDEEMTMGEDKATKKSDIGHAPGEHEISSEDIRNLEDVDDEDAAEIYDTRLIVLTRNSKRAFIETGVICLEMG
jgi:hypothetical protein